MQLLIKTQILVDESILLSDQISIEFRAIIHIIIIIIMSITASTVIIRTVIERGHFINQHFLKVLVQILYIRHEIVFILFLVLNLHSLFIIFRELLEVVNQFLNLVDQSILQMEELIYLVHKVIELLVIDIDVLMSRSSSIHIVLRDILHLSQITRICLYEVTELLDHLVIILQYIIDILNPLHKLFL